MTIIKFSCDACVSVSAPSRTKLSKIHWCVNVRDLAREECDAVQRFDMLEHGADADGFCIAVCSMKDEEIKWFEDRQIKFQPHVSPRRGTESSCRASGHKSKPKTEPKRICTCSINKHHMIRHPDDDIIVGATTGIQCHRECDVELSHEANGRSLKCTLTGFSKALYRTLMARVHAEATSKLIAKDRTEFYHIDDLVGVCSEFERNLVDVESFISDASTANYISRGTSEMILRDVHCLREALAFLVLAATHSSCLPSNRLPPTIYEMMLEWRQRRGILMDYYVGKRSVYAQKVSNQRLLEIASFVSYQFSGVEKWLRGKCNVSAVGILNCEALLGPMLATPYMPPMDRFIGSDATAVGFKFMKHEAATFGFKILGSLVSGTEGAYKMRHVAKKD